MAVFFVYAIRRVDCPTCGVTVERVPWATGKGHLKTSYRWFLARWAKRLSWSDTTVAFNTTLENVFRSVKYAVLWGVAHRGLSDIDAIGVDEIQWRSGHTYLTLVYQITGCKRLLWVSHKRTEQSLRRFLELLADDVRTGIRFVCSGALRSRLEPMKKVARSLRRYRPLSLNWFLALGGISSGVAEGFNGKAKLTTRKAYGFRTPQGVELALFHVMGNLPEPEFTHRFC